MNPKQRRRLSIPERLAVDLNYYLQKLITRLGLYDVVVKAPLHFGKLDNVRLKAGDPRRRPTSLLRANHRKYTLDEIQFALMTRLTRLLKFCNILFGRIAIVVEKGLIHHVDFTRSVRPNEKEDLTRFFARP